jgi:chorismate synthase
MATNSFGYLFRITTFGESHGKAIGVVLDGCPAGLPFDENDLQVELKKRSPGQSPYTTPRQEIDQGEILSGVFEGKTTGAPICIIVRNRDADSSQYEPIKDLLRPGHANYTYLEKYGIFDYRGGGRSSARETIGRVAAGAVAKKLLKHYDIEIVAYIKQIGSIEASIDENQDILQLQQATLKDLLFCPDEVASLQMRAAIEEIKGQGDSLGGIVEFRTSRLPVGLGDPIYEKLEANLADAMMSLPASKGFEIGSGFKTAAMKGSEHNDLFVKSDIIQTVTNYAGGTLGGITTGMPLVARVAFKPTSSIQKSQKTLDIQGETAHFNLPPGSRHDPCVAIRAVPIVEAMLALVLADAILINRCVRL